VVRYVASRGRDPDNRCPHAGVRPAWVSRRHRRCRRPGTPPPVGSSFDSLWWPLTDQPLSLLGVSNIRRAVRGVRGTTAAHGGRRVGWGD
jgi:hypothetical protein